MPYSIRRSLALALACFLGASPVFPITIGQGPVIGTDSAGNTYHEEFQDWTSSDLRCLGPVGSTSGRYNLNDGYDDSRDLAAFYSHMDSSPTGNVYFRVDLYDLKAGAENGFLDIYLAIDTGSTTAPQASFMPDFTDVQVDPSHNWELCVALYDSVNYKLYNGNYTAIDQNSSPTGRYLGAYYNSELDAVEFGITKASLYEAGWNGSSTLYFTVMTTKDSTDLTGGFGSTSNATDTFKDSDRGFSDGVINGAIASTDTAGRAKYASIAHGNQSINKAADINVHVYDPSVSQKTGFVRTLDTHEIFKVPLNMHLSGSLITSLKWAATSGGSSDLSDGPTFISRIKRDIDSTQTSVPLSLIGGVEAEHIMPYFEGAVNQTSMNMYEYVAKSVFGVGAADMKVMHTPERVIRSQATGFSPLNGFTFADISASSYTATVLDEVTHYHWWFDSGNASWSGDGGSEDKPAEHKLYKINGVYCFLINDREDQGKFGNSDNGMLLDTRYALLDKAMQSDQAQLTLVFDDWEALAGKSFDPGSGSPVANNNQIQYQNTIRWAANHPWIEIVNLKDILDRATNPGNPQYAPSWVVDEGSPTNLPIQTYEWLKHATEMSYDFWYYNNSGGAGNEQNFYNLVPVLTGLQGDYRARSLSISNDAAANAADGPKLPSGKALGDMNTVGTLIRDAWDDLNTAPSNALKTLGQYQFTNMIFETAWHEEDNGDYHSHNYQNSFTNPDTSWDGVNTWNLRLLNHVRDVGFLAYAARWAEQVRTGAQTAFTSVVSADLDQDGQLEYALRNNKVLAIFDSHGGKLLYAFHYHPTQGPICVIGAPASNPSNPGEEEGTGTSANRCSALKDMNTGAYADQVYTVATATPNVRSIRFTSADTLIQKTIELPDGAAHLNVSYVEGVSGALFVRVGVSPNDLDLMTAGRAGLSTANTGAGGYYGVLNSGGSKGAVYVTLPSGVTYNAAPSDTGYQNRNLALTEQIELSGNGSFSFNIAFDVADLPVGMSYFRVE